MSNLWQPQIGERVRVTQPDTFYNIPKGATGIIDSISSSMGPTVYYFCPDDPHPLNHIPFIKAWLEPLTMNEVKNNDPKKCVCSLNDLMIRGCTCGGE